MGNSLVNTNHYGTLTLVFWHSKFFSEVTFVSILLVLFYMLVAYCQRAHCVYTMNSWFMFVCVVCACIVHYCTFSGMMKCSL